MNHFVILQLKIWAFKLQRCQWITRNQPLTTEKGEILENSI